MSRSRQLEDALILARGPIDPRALRRNLGSWAPAMLNAWALNKRRLRNDTYLRWLSCGKLLGAFPSYLCAPPPKPTPAPPKPRKIDMTLYERIDVILTAHPNSTSAEVGKQVAPQHSPTSAATYLTTGVARGRYTRTKKPNGLWAYSLAASAKSTSEPAPAPVAPGPAASEPNPKTLALAEILLVPVDVVTPAPVIAAPEADPCDGFDAGPSTGDSDPVDWPDDTPTNWPLTPSDDPRDHAATFLLQLQSEARAARSKAESCAMDAQLAAIAADIAELHAKRVEVALKAAADAHARDGGAE